MNKLSGVSLIIPTADRLSDLGLLLESLKRLAPCSMLFEVIVVDNSESFSARSLVLSFDSNYDLRYVEEHNQGLHYGRHAGFRQAKYDILGYLDDDVVLGKNWLKGVERAFCEYGADMATGNCLPMFSISPPSWFLNYWSDPRKAKRKIFSFWPYSIIKFQLSSYSVIDPTLVWGCNFVVTKKLVKRFGGFHPDGLPSKDSFKRGDGESYIGMMAKKMDCKAIFVEDLLVFHKVSSNRLTNEYLYRRGYNEGITQGYIELRYSGEQSWSSRIRQMYAKISHVLRLFFIQSEIGKAFTSLDDGIKAGRRDYFIEYSKSKCLQRWVAKKDYL